MPTFRFRADAALTFRRRQLEEAQRELARKERDRLEASGRAERAAAAVSEAKTAAIPPAGAPIGAHAFEWQRFWITRLQREQGRDNAALAAREAAVTTARTACTAARQKCRALERLREKAWARHLAADAAEERKVIDDIAVRRMDARRRQRDHDNEGATA
jgi:flagellar export protein FliJ